VSANVYLHFLIIIVVINDNHYCCSSFTFSFLAPRGQNANLVFGIIPVYALYDSNVVGLTTCSITLASQYCAPHWCRHLCLFQTPNGQRICQYGSHLLVLSRTRKHWFCLYSLVLPFGLYYCFSWNILYTMIDCLPNRSDRVQYGSLCESMWQAPTVRVGAGQSRTYLLGSDRACPSSHMGLPYCTEFWSAHNGNFGLPLFGQTLFIYSLKHKSRVMVISLCHILWHKEYIII
jgi:hypothetical protein